MRAAIATLATRGGAWLAVFARALAAREPPRISGHGGIWREARALGARRLPASLTPVRSPDRGPVNVQPDPREVVLDPWIAAARAARARAALAAEDQAADSAGDEGRPGQIAPRREDRVLRADLLSAAFARRPGPDRHESTLQLTGARWLRSARR